MLLNSTVFTGDKCIMQMGKKAICQTTKELIESELFAEVVMRFVDYLDKHNSPLLAIFDNTNEDIEEKTINNLISTLKLLSNDPVDLSGVIFPEVIRNFMKKPELLNNFVEGLYNYWRSFIRFFICFEKIDHRVFNKATERLSHLIKVVYRNMEENITGHQCKIYRQVHAGSQFGLVVVETEWPCPYEILRSIPMIRQVVLSPPIIINPSMNKRDGQFKKIEKNPLEGWCPDLTEWLCYPAKVGNLLIYIFFHQVFMELGCSLANLFELAEDDLEKKPDGIVVYGMDEKILREAVFFDDTKNGVLVGTIPASKEFGYFGYLKKMTLTLHNIAIMKQGKMPYHGMMVHILLKNGNKAGVLIIGDTATGKSETLAALQAVGSEYISDIIIIADDMGSLEISPEDEFLAYGTETGAFLRLDDLHPGFVMEQIDRAIIMSIKETNARIVLPVTTFDNITKGYAVDHLLYANNYEQVDHYNPVIERFSSYKDALYVFREGASMSKGTTTLIGIGHSYFANPFGPIQYKELHECLARKIFKFAFKKNIFVGQLRTRLGIPGWETKGPGEGASALLELISSQIKKGG